MTKTTVTDDPVAVLADQIENANQAFPTTVIVPLDKGKSSVLMAHGLSKREYIAAMIYAFNSDADPEEAVRWADSLLAALNPPKEKHPNTFPIKEAT